MDINLNECLRYLGCKTKDEDVINEVKQCILEIEQTATPKFTYKIFDITVEDGVLLQNSDICFQSDDIVKLLKDCKKCVLLAATMGASLDRQMAYYQKTNLSKAVVLDACANEAIESVVREAVEEIKDKGMSLTPRFSPGYGDFSIMYQKDFIFLLDAYKTIGLTATSSMLLTPTKSVTAIIGIK